MLNSTSNFLNRFTTVPFAIDLLTRKQLTLLNPSLWEDYNDRVTMELYRQKKKVESIYALCLTDKRETIHHWNAFANGTSGCCIEFDSEKLFASIRNMEGVIHGKTEYIKVAELSKLDNDNEKLPYLKREPFKPENEYRIVALSNNPQQTVLDIPIKIEIIKRITISNKLPKTIFQSVKQCLYKISPEFKGKISHSTLFENTNWINHFNKLSSKE